MNKRLLAGLCVTAVLTAAGCSSDDRESIRSDVESAASQVGDAAGDALNDAAEALTRNIATQQGEEQFKNAGHTLAGPLTCDATVQDGVDKIDVSCTGTTQEGGAAAALTGTTDEIPGASVVSLSGTFVGTVDGAEVFRVDQLGG